MHIPAPHTPGSARFYSLTGYLLPIAALLLLGLAVGAGLKQRPAPTDATPGQQDTSTPDTDEPRPVSGQEVS
jgi:hypothetical protein